MIQAPVYFNFANDIFDNWAERQPDSPALWCVNHREEKFSFAEVAALSRQAANFFRSAGVAKGDRVLIVLPRISQWWIAMLGLIRVGAVPVPATLLMTERDLLYRVRTANISAVLTDSEGAEKLESVTCLRFLTGGDMDGWVNFDAGLCKASAEFDPVQTLADDPGIIYFTSATTGDPKMVLHTQASYGLGHRQTGELWLDLRPNDVHWNISDVGWGKAAWSGFYGPWNMGACIFAVHSQGRFDPVKTLQVLENFPITTWCAPPTALRLIIRQDISKYRFPLLRHAVTAGEPLNPEVLALWKQATGLTLHEGYGQTETVVLVGNFRSLGKNVRPGSMGTANPHFHVAIVDDDLREVPDGEEGEVALRIHPRRPVGLFKEYWRNPEACARQFRGDWYLTGDRASRDADGYFWFVGRGDDVIKSSGYRIGPFEVESALIEHPTVLDVAVVGKPDAIRGQIVKAYIVLRDTIVADTKKLQAELKDHCKRLVAPYKYPREIEFVAELPKTTSGKTRHFELRKRN